MSYKILKKQVFIGLIPYMGFLAICFTFPQTYIKLGFLKTLLFGISLVIILICVALPYGLLILPLATGSNLFYLFTLLLTYILTYVIILAEFFFFKIINKIDERKKTRETI